jgi:hypothetical protein
MYVGVDAFFHRVDVFAQVYGGAISLKVGSYARSQIGTGDSDATCEETVCDSCSVSISHVMVKGSSAVSEAIGDILFFRSSDVLLML